MKEYLFLVTIPDFLSFIKQFGYVGIFIWFVTFDQLTPIPEEFSLLLLGYLIANHVFDPFLAGIAAVAGFLTIDIIYYFLSRSGSRLVRKKRENSESSFTRKYKEKLQNNLPKTLLILSFIPRLRLMGPILVGALKVPFKKFMLFNTIGVCLVTLIYITLGVIFQESLSLLFHQAKAIQNIIFFASIAAVAIIIIITLKNRRRAGNRQLEKRSLMKQ